MKLYSKILKHFSKSQSTLPPKLQHKNPVKDSKKKVSPIYNLIKSEKLAESKSEKLNLEEKVDYEKIVNDASSSMRLNYFKIYQDKKVLEKDLKDLCEYIEKMLNPIQISSFINHLKESKKIIESEEVDKSSPEVFKIFVDKLYNLSENKSITKSLINMVSKIGMKDLSAEEIFKNSKKGELNLNSSGEKKGQTKQLQRSIYYSQLESNYSSTLNIRNPVTNDVDKPESDFKDAFLMKFEYTFKDPLLIQQNSIQSKFAFSNYVFFHQMPFFYPVRDKETDKTVVKHLNNEIILKNGINLKKNSEYKGFVEKYLERALEEGFNLNFYSNSLNPLYKKNVKIEVLNFFSKKTRHNDYYDSNLVNEAVDFIDEVFENTEEGRDIGLNKMSRYRTYNKGKDDEIQHFDEILQNTKYNELRQSEVERVIKGSVKEPIYSNGLLLFNSYEDKKHFLKSGAGTFGLHLQGKNVRFYDADFCNIIEAQQFIGETNLEHIKKIINLRLRLKNQHNLLLEIPSYVNEMTSLCQKIDTQSVKIYLRFNDFHNALKFFRIVKEDRLNKLISAKFSKPAIRYYNAHYFNGMELVIKNTVKNLEKIITVPSNYCEINNILEKEII